MSVWRRKAIECLPAMKKEFERKSLSIYEVFSEVLAETIKAHKENDKIRLKKYYDFAEWCFRQKEKDLCNAAGVSFYEHLGDQAETLLAMPLWVKRHIYSQIRDLLKLRLPEEELKKIDKLYNI